MHWKDFLYYQRGEKLALIILLTLIFIGIVVNASLIAREPNIVVINRNDSLIADFELRYNAIEVDTNRLLPSSNSQRTYKTVHKPNDSRYQRYNSDKLKSGETILLNSADTTEWKKVPGIGSSFASRIVKYRNLLGGYISAEQLREVYGMDEERYETMLPYIEVDGYVKKININKLEFKELLKHPYINYDQVQAIFSLRRKKGDIKSINELAMLNEFTRDDIIRIEPYLEF